MGTEIKKPAGRRSGRPLLEKKRKLVLVGVKIWVYLEFSLSSVVPLSLSIMPLPSDPI